MLSGQIFCIIMMCSNINFSNVLQYQTASTSIASWVRTLTAAGQIFCIIMMCSAACFFGLVLGELQEIHAAANTTVSTLPDSVSTLPDIQARRASMGGRKWLKMAKHVKGLRAGAWGTAAVRSCILVESPEPIDSVMIRIFHEFRQSRTAPHAKGAVSL